MRYLMLVCTDPDHTRADSAAAPPIDEWVDQTTTDGTRLMGERLRPARDARTVRVRGGEVLVTDGPFTESKEWIAGFDILECADIEAAVAIAARHPMAWAGRIEVRAFWPFEEEAAS